jgi:outer membrane murein-binding lipoprotein Lpp
MSTKTHDPRVQVANHGPANWRTEVQDEPGAAWDITGPPYPTKAEALLHVDETAERCFGTPVSADQDTRALRSRIGQLTAQVAELERKVNQYRSSNGALMVDADRREQRAALAAEDCAEHGKGLRYLRHLTGWYWAAMVQQEDARQAVVMMNLNTAKRMREQGADATVKAADVAAWLEKNVSAQRKVLRRPAGYPTLADCARAGGCDHDGLADGVKAEVAEALGITVPAA